MDKNTLKKTGAGRFQRNRARLFPFLRGGLCALLLLLLLSGTAFADSLTDTEPGFSNFTKKQDYTENPFKDVRAGAWFEASVESVYNLGLMNGKNAATFAPNESVTLCEAISMAAKTHHIYNGGDGALPSSGKTKPWYSDALDYAVKHGIIKAGEFSNYEAPATRAQLAYLFSGAVPREALAPISAVDALPDVSERTPYSDEILLLYRAGVVSGTDKKGTYAPNQKITRAEAASILSRVAVPAKRSSFILLKDPDPQGTASVFWDWNKEFCISASNDWSDALEDDNSKKSAENTANSSQLRLDLLLSAVPAEKLAAAHEDDPPKPEVMGEIFAYAPKKSNASAPLSIFHELVTENLTAQLEGSQITPAVRITLSDGAVAYISSLLSSEKEACRYWVLTADGNGGYVTLVGRVVLNQESQLVTELSNEMICTLKSLKLSQSAQNKE